MSTVANILASPLIHVPLLIGACLILQKFRGGRMWLYNSIIGVLLGWFIFCTLPYTSTLLIHRLEHHYPVIDFDDEEWQSADAIVVLACSFYDEEKLPFTSRWHDCSAKRNLQAALMYKERPTPIYLSGGQIEQSDYTHADFNRTFLMQLGVPTEDILLSRHGKNTDSESKALLPMIDGKTIALVTSASHQIRATNYFKALGIKVIQVPVEHLSRPNISFVLGWPSANNLYRSERAIHEYLGLLAQTLFSD